MKRPNILFVQVDQLAATTLNMYGDTVCHSPTLTGLAEKGVVFENAYCNFPLCAPSRFSMAAGQLCSAIGAYDNAAEFFAEIPTYAHHLRKRGYRTALSGKMHFIGPDQFHGFESRLTADLYPADFSWVPNWGNEGKRDTNDPRSVTISGTCQRSVQIDFDEEVTHQAVRALYDFARAGDDQPFFLQVSYTHPHEPYLCKPEYWQLYENIEIPAPVVGAMPEDQHDAHSVRLLKDFGMLDFQFSDDEIQRARRAYYGSVSYIDSMLAELLAALEATGQRENTAIVFTSDHGDMLGERGMWFKKHFYEKSLRIPLIVCAPWINAQRITELVSLVDLLPTFNGIADGSTWEDTSQPLEGCDLTNLLDRPVSEQSRTVYAEYLAEATTAPLFMVRRGQYKFIHSSNDPDLLFDIVNDPDELENLATDPAHAALVSGFQDQVAGKWDSNALSEKIRQSQQRRLFIREAMKLGNNVRWNHGEHPDQDVRWYRGNGTYNDWAFDFLP